MDPLDSAEKSLLEQADAPKNEGFDFIALDELCPPEFRLLYNNCRRALQDYKLAGPGKEIPAELFAGVVECWEEFLAALERDGRLESDG